MSRETRATIREQLRRCQGLTSQQIELIINDLDGVSLTFLLNMPERTPSPKQQLATIPEVEKHLAWLRQFSFRSTGAFAVTLESGSNPRDAENIEALGVEPLDKMERVVRDVKRFLHAIPTPRRGPTPGYTLKPLLRKAVHEELDRLAKWDNRGNERSERDSVRQSLTSGGRRSVRTLVTVAVLQDFDRRRLSLLRLQRPRSRLLSSAVRRPRS